MYVFYTYTYVCMYNIYKTEIKGIRIQSIIYIVYNDIIIIVYKFFMVTIKIMKKFM